MLTGKHLMMVVNADWFLLSHRAALVTKARDAGMRVTVCAQDTGRADEVRALGAEFVQLPFSRQGVNPMSELGTVWALFRCYRRVAPDLVHHVTSKPVIYGSLAASLLGLPVINAISGMGSLFTRLERGIVFRHIVLKMYKTALRRSRSWTIFQNPDDAELFARMGALVADDREVLIRGSGVHPEKYQRAAVEDMNPVRVLFASRLLWDKGVSEFLDAIKNLRDAGYSPNKMEVVIAGASDPGNPTAIPEAELQQRCAEAEIRWLGHCSDMPATLATAGMLVLPSYREGLPKTLLEGCAAGVPVIATDVPGCRECCLHMRNGLLVESRSAPALAAAIRTLVDSPELRKRLGEEGARLAKTEFSLEAVQDKTIAAYQKILASRIVSSQP